MALYTRFLSECDWLYVAPGAVFCVYLLLSSCVSGLSSWACVEKKFFMIKLECTYFRKPPLWGFSCSILYSSPSESSTGAVDVRSSAFQRSSLT